MANLAEALKRDPSLRIKVDGHTDSDGTPEGNKVLSKDRAKAVALELINTYDIDSGRLKAFGYGQEQPVASNATPEGKAANRRVTVSKLAP